MKGDRDAFVERLRSQAFECRETDADVFRVLMPPGAGAGSVVRFGGSTSARRCVI